MIACCVVTCALLAVASAPCSLLLSLSEHHYAQNIELSESVRFMFVLSLFICLKVVSRHKETLFRAKIAGGIERKRQWPLAGRKNAGRR